MGAEEGEGRFSWRHLGSEETDVPGPGATIAADAARTVERMMIAMR